MLTKEEYLASPCSVSSLPFWKEQNIEIPKDMLIVHDSQFSEEYLLSYYDERYFRLYHNMKNLINISVDGVYLKTAEENDIESLADIINRSYTDIKVSGEQIAKLKHTQVYKPELWVLVKNIENDFPVACGIGDFDGSLGELILEWIQVLPEYRGRKIGQMIVNELLCRMAGKAKFATVSGKMDNRTCPEILYRKCGFTGNDIWHIMRRK